MARAPAPDSEKMVVSIQLPRELVAEVDRVLEQGPKSATRSGLMRELLATGLAHYIQGPIEPEPQRGPLREPAWGPELRALHAKGLTVAEMSAELGLTAVNVRRRLFVLGIRANR